MMQTVNLTDHFLIAMPNMGDPYFSKSLTYICEHNEHGALGVVVNRPLDMKMQTLFEQIGITPPEGDLCRAPVYFGGPVQMDRGFVLHQPVGHWQSTLVINPDIGLTTSKDILESLGIGEGPERVLIALGYSGWAPGQLEHELGQNAWLTVNASPDIIFEMPFETRLAAAMATLGVDFASLSEEAGHA